MACTFLKKIEFFVHLYKSTPNSIISYSIRMTSYTVKGVTFIVLAKNKFIRADCEGLDATFIAYDKRYKAQSINILHMSFVEDYHQLLLEYEADGKKHAVLLANAIARSLQITCDEIKAEHKSKLNSFLFPITIEQHNDFMESFQHTESRMHQALISQRQRITDHIRVYKENNPGACMTQSKPSVTVVLM